MKHYTHHQLQLIRPRYFVKHYLKVLPTHKTAQDAYEAVEAEHIEAFGARKYKDFESFKTIKSRLLKAK